ncbi:hypothetical protein B296_00011383 [Ensete ventricosum]|uniref:Uncharacterized protein n=1 Tax=Ensete ventricosum TaxID=4639 RepID=A0A426ZYJ7_ENSVE|nr:hypothetical protein B296_00011383 [Ensete ventricosum]
MGNNVGSGRSSDDLSFRSRVGSVQQVNGDMVTIFTVDVMVATPSKLTNGIHRSDMPEILRKAEILVAAMATGGRDDSHDAALAFRASSSPSKEEARPYPSPEIVRIFSPILESTRLLLLAPKQFHSVK